MKRRGSSGSYQVRYLSSVARNDIPAISPLWRRRIQKGIEEKLSSRPEVFGKPLRYALKNIWRLRVGDYRVIYSIEKETVLIITIQHRSVAYKEALRRLS